MSDILTSLLSDKKGGIIFRCFDLWHIGFILFFGAVAVVACFYLRMKDDRHRSKVISAFINAAFGLYMLDFFLMPFAYGEIDIEKLPFHICTAMCVMCFVSRHNTFLGKFKLQFAMLGFLSNLVYLIYPAGVMWHSVHPASYRVIQTLSFHGIMMVYGLLVLVYERKEVAWKKDLIVIVSMTIWALLGNTMYNSDARVYNWFFVVRDPFNMLPANIAPFVMPFLNVAVFFGTEMLVYFLPPKITKTGRYQCNRKKF